MAYLIHKKADVKSPHHFTISFHLQRQEMETLNKELMDVPDSLLHVINSG